MLKRLKTTCLLGLLALNCLIAPASQATAQPASSIAQAHHKTREVDLQDAPRDYSVLLKRPEKLGFEPRRQHFQKALELVRKTYVDPVDDATLIASIRAALLDFITQAKVETESLSQLDGAELDQMFTRVQEVYGHKVNRDLLGYVVLLGLAQGVKDHHSYLMTPDEGAQLRAVLRPASFSGIGVFMEVDASNGGSVTLTEIVDGGPAAQAGLEVGDKILKIDGKSIAGLGLEVVQSKVRGSLGSTLVLTVRHRNTETRDVSLKRAEIKSQLVMTRKFPGDVGYVRLRIFGLEAQEQLHQALMKMRADKVKGIIFDLRNNGGGYVDSAVGVVGEFAPAHSLVTFTIDREGHQHDYRTTKGGGVDVPMILLVNEYSASASELTAGALRDLKLATLVGDQTFGKGSVQQLFSLEESRLPPLLRLTIAHFFSPNGTTIHQLGVQPEVMVEMEPRLVGKFEEDTQLKKALDVLSGKIGSQP